MSANKDPDNDQDSGMSKYAVDEDGSGTKTAAAQQGTCPACGATLESANTTNVLKCPRCGTKPFEGTR